MVNMLELECRIIILMISIIKGRTNFSNDDLPISSLTFDIQESSLPTLPDNPLKERLSSHLTFFTPLEQIQIHNRISPDGTRCLFKNSEMILNQPSPCSPDVKKFINADEDLKGKTCICTRKEDGGMSIVVNEKIVTEESNNFQINGSQCDIAGILIPFNVTVPCRKEFNRVLNSSEDVTEMNCTCAKKEDGGIRLTATKLMRGQDDTKAKGKLSEDGEYCEFGELVIRLNQTVPCSPEISRFLNETKDQSLKFCKCIKTQNGDIIVTAKGNMHLQKPLKDLKPSGQGKLSKEISVGTSQNEPELKSDNGKDTIGSMATGIYNSTTANSTMSPETTTKTEQSLGELSEDGTACVFGERRINLNETIPCSRDITSVFDETEDISNALCTCYIREDGKGIIVEAITKGEMSDQAELEEKKKGKLSEDKTACVFGEIQIKVDEAGPCIPEIMSLFADGQMNHYSNMSCICSAKPNGDINISMTGMKEAVTKDPDTKDPYQ
ncbi:uncharacterized protein LOC111714287 [Eurytemora carolleeae]|uniref:uncharacterized protein LOC111714287 n=1 Tax=Eurytemora carolleeae TaxID=1294199 RepID=UPI000C77CB36|nr:uncharacterized protein LOC111714287 [Eurytemora carolleeae]|eukprot:XP_023345126.1 uncharacterized protein LOC111714287 [Eurytemora affinis]